MANTTDADTIGASLMNFKPHFNTVILFERIIPSLLPTFGTNSLRHGNIKKPYSYINTFAADDVYIRHWLSCYSCQ